jgi:hypothetical protein
MSVNAIKFLKQEQVILKKQLIRIEKALSALGGDIKKGVTKAFTKKRTRKRKPMSEATKAKLRAAAVKRWAKVKKAA